MPKETLREIAIRTGVAELYDRYHEMCVKLGDNDILDYDEVIGGFANAVVDTCEEVVREQPNPVNLNYKPSERFGDEVGRIKF